MKTKKPIASTSRNINDLVNEAISVVSADFSDSEMRIEHGLKETGDKVSISTKEIVPVITKLLAAAVGLSGGTGRIFIEKEHVVGKRHNDRCDFIRLGIRIAELSVVRDGFDMIIEKVQSVQNLLSVDSRQNSTIELPEVEQVILKWGGNIWVKVEIGRGLTFNITVPLSEKAESSPASPASVTVVNLARKESARGLTGLSR